MSQEIHFDASLSIFKSSVMSGPIGRSVVDLIADMIGNGFIESEALIGTSATAIPLGSVTQPHWGFFRNAASLGTPTAITGAVNNGSGLIRLTSTNHGLATDNVVLVKDVLGTTEANGGWSVIKIDANTIDLQNSTFTNTYKSGGTITLANALTIRNGSGGADLVQLMAGEAACLPLLIGSVPYGVANAAAHWLEYLIANL